MPPPSIYAAAQETPSGHAASLPVVTRREVKNVHVGADRASSFQDAKLRYKMAKPSFLASDRLDLGGAADAQYFHGIDFWRMRELARAADRDDPHIGQLVNRGLDQILGTGFRVDPQTGDKSVDAVLLKLWNDWTEDPASCDWTGRLTFDDMERLAMRAVWIDGDVFGILDDRTGTVRMEEGDRVTSASDFSMDVVHGVDLDPETARVRGYHFLRTVPGERFRKIRRQPSVQSDQLVFLPARFVLHVFRPERFSQNRGLTAFHAVWDRLALVEDIEFAELVKLQVSSCIAAWVTTEYGTQFGSRDTETGLDSTTQLTFDEFTPGMIPQLRPGESIQTFSPTVSTQDSRAKVREILREIGLAIGLPLELSLLDNTENNFSGHRATVEAYKKTAKVQQRWFGRAFRSAVYRWKVRAWVTAGLVPPLPDILVHQVHYPEWQYLDPEKDAAADVLRIEKLLASPRQVAAERGRDHQRILSESIEDRGKMIEAAMAEAARLGEDITWQDVLGLDTPPPPPAPEPEQPAPEEVPDASE